MSEQMLNLGEAVVNRATDPVILPNYTKPVDFAAQYPTPLDTTEILAMCEEITAWRAIPETPTSLNQHYWREMTSLQFNSGSTYIAFQDGYCPEEYTHNGGNLTVDIKNIGAKKNLSIRDIMHSSAVASANWNGINTLVGGVPGGEGVPGASDVGSFVRQTVMDVKEKEIRLAMTLVMNGWDRLLVRGDHVGNPLEFTGIENWEANNSVTFASNDNSASGTFSAATFDRWLAEPCANPTHIFGHPQAIQEMLSGYFQLGFAGSQTVNFSDGNRVIPGFNFAGFVNTSVGRLTVVADINFTKTNIGSTTAFQASLWALRMTHNGEPLVYRTTQIPLSLTDLNPGCTAVSFQVWAATALVIKHACTQGRYRSQFAGRLTVSNCTQVG
jgi:hypothetical protein